MIKDIITIVFNSLEVEKKTDNNNNITLFRIDTPAIQIRNKGILKVSNFCHIGTATGHTDNIYLFRIKNVNVDTSRFYTGSGGYPLILTTTFNNNRSLYDENIITLTEQTINSIEILVDTHQSEGIGDGLSITNGGSGYLAGQRLKLLINSIEYEINVDTVSSGAITKISYIDTLPTTIPSITLTNYITGSGAVLNAVLFTDFLYSIQIINGGFGYKGNQTLILTGGGGTGASAYITSVNSLGQITGITISTSGFDYISPPAVSISPTTQTQTAVFSQDIKYGNIIKESFPNTLNFSITFIIEQDINE